MPQVKKSHALNFYKLQCERVSYSCPALPYRISFQQLDQGVEATALPSSIENQEALPAYVDLLTSAECALPLGQSDYDNPLLTTLWSEVELGGQYLLGGSTSPVNIIVHLTGRPSGYEVDDCRIATGKDFAEFQKKLAKWKQALQIYYDVYQ